MGCPTTNKQKGTMTNKNTAAALKNSQAAISVVGFDLLNALDTLSVTPKSS